jgi:hypothetical protein
MDDLDDVSAQRTFVDFKTFRHILLLSDSEIRCHVKHDKFNPFYTALSSFCKQEILKKMGMRFRIPIVSLHVLRT